MRWSLAIACLAGCSFTPGQPHGVVPDDATADGTPDAPGDVAVDTPLPAPFSLDGEQWLLPCTPGTNGDPNSRACHCANGVTHGSQIAGGGVQRWHVTVHVRGVMERMTYVGGTAMGAWYVGGSAGDTGNNIYELTISSPAQHYFLNHGSTSQNYSTVHDYTAAFDIDGGATVDFLASGQDGVQWEGVDMNDAPISLAGVVDPPQPYNGQFAILDVISADPI